MSGADPQKRLQYPFCRGRAGEISENSRPGSQLCRAKDKHAVTEQWLCARVPGKAMPDLSAFQLEGCKVLEYARHKRKLRLGALKGNAFTLVLRDISQRDEVESRLKAINEAGVPNYFGAQRFGIGGSNIQGALRWAQSDAPVRDRNKRSFWLSAARSALFNQIVSERLKNQTLIKLLTAMRYN